MPVMVRLGLIIATVCSTENVWGWSFMVLITDWNQDDGYSELIGSAWDPSDQKSNFLQINFSRYEDPADTELCRANGSVVAATFEVS